MQSTEYLYGYARDLINVDYPKATNDIEKLKILVEAKTLFGWLVLEDDYEISRYKITELINEVTSNLISK